MCLCTCAEDANWHPGKCFVPALRCIELAEIEALGPQRPATNTGAINLQELQKYKSSWPLLR